MKSELTITRMSKSSWFKMVFNQLVIHVDPGFGGFFESQGISLDDMKDQADYIFISHEHKDHMRDEAIEKLYKKDTKIICSKSCSEHLRWKHEIILPEERKKFSHFSLESIYAYNTQEGHSTKKYHPRDTYLGFIFTFDDFRIYFAGDTDITDEMKSLQNINLAMLPIGGTYVMDFEEAIIATAILHPTYVIPMHHAHENLEDFKVHVEKETQAKAIVLHNGESYTF